MIAASIVLYVGLGIIIAITVWNTGKRRSHEACGARRLERTGRESITMGTWLCVAPVAPYMWDHPGGLPIDMGSGVKLVSLPPWAVSDEAISVLSSRLQDKIRQSSNVALTVEYDANSLGETDPTWGGPEPRSVQAAALEAIVNANLALWLVRPSAFGFEVAMHFDRPGDPTSCRSAFSIEPLKPGPTDLEEMLSIDDVLAACQVHSALQTLKPFSTVWMASRLLWKALTEATWEMRLLFIWVGLEALYGPDSGQETTHQLAERIALFLARDRVEARQFFRTAKSSYRMRSKVAHGNRIASLTRGEFGPILRNAETLLRRTLDKIVLDQEHLRIFCSSRRDEFLSELIFQPLSRE